MTATRHIVILALLTSMGVACSSNKECKEKTVRIVFSCNSSLSTTTGLWVRATAPSGSSKEQTLEPFACPGSTSLEISFLDYPETGDLKLSVQPLGGSSPRPVEALEPIPIQPGCTSAKIQLEEAYPPIDGGPSTDAEGESSDGGNCLSGDRRCSGFQVQVCEGSTWMIGETCANACVDGACGGECRPGTKGCNGKTPTACNGVGVQVSETACSNLCENGECVGECTPRTRKCLAQVPQLCTDDARWTSEPECQTTCVDGLCGGCTKGQTKCSGDVPFTCETGGVWTKGATCQYVCDVATGKCGGQCKPGSVRCGTGERVETCGLDGTWTAKAQPCQYLCSNGECVGECTPTAKTCGAGKTPMTCSQAAKWVSGTACQFVCSEGNCVGDCTPTSSQCNAAKTAVDTCDSLGVWKQSLACPNGCTGSTCNECAKGSLKCDGTTRYSCPDGRWLMQSCPYACSAGLCTGNCSPGSRKCENYADNGRAFLCNSEGQWVSDAFCGVRCDVAVGACRECIPGERACWEDGLFGLAEGDIAYTVCIADGVHNRWGTVLDCRDTGGTSILCKNSGANCK